MKSSKPDPSSFQKWKVAFREHAPLLISVGYTLGRYKIESDRHEEQDITGLEGMGCFTEGIYASGYDEAAMLGYVQSNTLFEWKERVKKSITKKAAGLYLTSPQYDEIVIAEIPLEWVSEHERHNGKGRSVRIYHIFLDCLPPEK